MTPKQQVLQGSGMLHMKCMLALEGKLFETLPSGFALECSISSCSLNTAHSLWARKPATVSLQSHTIELKTETSAGVGPRDPSRPERPGDVYSVWFGGEVRAWRVEFSGVRYSSGNL